MRKIISILILVGILQSGAFAQSGHHITIRVQQWKDTILYLGNYYGHQTYLYDSARMDHQGIAVFSGKEEMPPGIYFVLMPGKRLYFEMLVPPGKQHFEVTTDTTDLANKVIFDHSPDNELFLAYNHFLQGESKQLNETRAGSNPSDSAGLQRLQQTINRDIDNYRQKIIKEHPESMLSTIFLAMTDPVPPKLPEGKTDSLFAYHYSRDHYWDHISFKDSMLLRTPILEERLKKYFTRLIAPVPDSINNAADALLARAKQNKSMHKYVLWWLTHTYESSPYMGMDAVFVHLVEKYYVPPAKVDWLSDEQLSKIIERAYAIAPNLIGQKAPDLALKDTLLHPVSLYSIQSKYTLLVFWDPTCGHCMTEVPRMDSAYRASWKKSGVTMVGIRSDGTPQQWEEFIQQHHLNGWIHLWDPDNTSRFRQLYDVYSTPVVYLLDKDKKIIAKRLDVKGVTDFLQHVPQL